MNDEKSEFSLYTELLTRLQELESVINNALGSEHFGAEVNTYKPIKPKVVDVERLAAKNVSSSPSIAKSPRSRKLMPENLIYKDEETEPREDPPEMGDAEMPKNVEDSELPEDSQEKQLELALETALALLRKKKNTLSVIDSEANRVRPPLDS
jgi:hypothetical protein